MPRCSKCKMDHFNFKPCPSKESGFYGWGGGAIEWKDKDDGFLEWGDRVKDDGWGCKTILPRREH